MGTQSTRRNSLTIVLVFAALIPQSVAQSPTTLPLVQSSNMRYLGSFRLPTNDGSGASTGDLTYGGTALALSSGGGLFVRGHDWSQRLCEVSIPAIGGTATIRQRCVDVTEGRMPQIDVENGIKLGGALVWNGRLITTGFSYYDADTSATKSHFASGTTLATAGDVTGPVQVGTVGAGWVSGQMTPIPSEWRSLLGGPALTGNCCLSIISRTSSGPSVSVFNPDDVGRVTPVPATRLLGYPVDRPLANPNNANGLYTHSDQVGGFAFPAGTRSVLFVGRHGTGNQCYGDGSACNDPADSYKGYHSYPYYHQVWAYDANDLLAVKNGTRQVWELRPYATWRLTEMNNSGSATIAGAAYDPTTRRMYVTEQYGSTPKVHVYEITSGVAAPPPPPGPEICGDGVDNDQDGQIDEGCPPPGPPPPPTPEICGDGIDNDQDGQIDEGCPTTPPAPPSPQERCGDGVDNDSDGLVDEGCPGPPQQLVGEVQGNHVLLSWLAPITGTVPSQYIVEAGIGPGQAQFSGPTTQTSSRVNNVGTGKYYVRVRSQNGAGVSLASNEVTVSVGCSGTPNPLTNLLTKVRGGLVKMTWTDPDGCNDTSYQLAVSDANGQILGVLSSESNAITALAGPGTYFLRAVAVSSRGMSTPTAPTKLVVNSSQCVPPQFTTRLTSQVTGSLVQLAWNPTNIADALNADSLAPIIYVLEAGTGPGLSNLLRVPLGRTTFLAAPAPSGTYYLRVKPADVCGLGTSSNEVIVRVP